MRKSKANECQITDFLLQTFTLNGDAYATSSTYLYKVRDSADGVGKIYWGPLWDFDFGWDKQPHTTGIPYGHEWMKPMLYVNTEAGFVAEIHEQWKILKEKLEMLIAEGGIIDGYYEETKASASLSLSLLALAVLPHRKKQFS